MIKGTDPCSGNYGFWEKPTGDMSTVGWLIMVANVNKFGHRLIIFTYKICASLLTSTLWGEHMFLPLAGMCSSVFPFNALKNGNGVIFQGWNPHCPTDLLYK